MKWIMSEKEKELYRLDHGEEKSENIIIMDKALDVYDITSHFNSKKQMGWKINGVSVKKEELIEKMEEILIEEKKSFEEAEEQVKNPYMEDGGIIEISLDFTLKFNLKCFEEEIEELKTINDEEIIIVRYRNEKRKKSKK